MNAARRNLDNKRRALVAGASGMVGRQLLDLLMADPLYVSVHAIGRRPLSIAGLKFSESVLDYDTLEPSELPPVDDVFCCLGTTIREAGSERAFRRVDHDYVVSVARAARAGGATRFVMISSMGASTRSMVFYNRVKGTTEADVSALGYPSTIIVRPSLLVGDRTEYRTGELIASTLLSALRPIIPAKYRSIEGRTVARAMLVAAKGASDAMTEPLILESDRLTGIANSGSLS